LLRDRGISKTIPITIQVPGELNAIIYGSIAIIICSVADLGGIRVDQGISIITIVVIKHVSGRWITGNDGHCGIPKTIPIRIFIPCLVSCEIGIITVDQAVAIIVHSIATFGCVRVYQRVGIIAVIVVTHRAGWLIAGEDGCIR
jgi:hypothetical protein